MQAKQIAQRLFSHLSRWLVRGVFFLVCRTKIVYFGNLPTGTGYILASNHISHFDPPFLGSRFRRYVDWMTMEELFRNRASAALMESLCAFKVRRDGTDRTGIRTAVKRLEQGRVVGVFPEGGIRAGKGSVLEGAPMWPGVSALSVLSGKPIVPGVILGTDRLYDKRNWFRIRRVAVWIGFGESISPRSDLPKRDARELIQKSLSEAFISLKKRLVLRVRVGRNGFANDPTGQKARGLSPLNETTAFKIKTFVRMQTAASLDAVMCALINGIQWRLQNHVCTPEELDIYLSACEPISRDSFYQVQGRPDVVRVGNYLEWRSPVQTAFPENQTARARVFLSGRGFSAPTVIFLHALMSAHRRRVLPDRRTVESSWLECGADALALSLLPGAAWSFQRSAGFNVQPSAER